MPHSYILTRRLPSELRLLSSAGNNSDAEVASYFPGALGNFPKSGVPKVVWRSEKFLRRNLDRLSVIIVGVLGVRMSLPKTLSTDTRVFRGLHCCFNLLLQIIGK
jgi:hypothetical protein